MAAILLRSAQSRRDREDFVAWSAVHTTTFRVSSDVRVAVVIPAAAKPTTNNTKQP
jgi:hypothetical protein